MRDLIVAGKGSKAFISCVYISVSWPFRPNGRERVREAAVLGELAVGDCSVLIARLLASYLHGLPIGPTACAID